MSPTPFTPPSFLARRFASKAARFHTAVACGFILAAVGAVSGLPGARAIRAGDGFWGLSALFGAPPAQRVVTRGFEAAPPFGRRVRHRMARRRGGIVVAAHQAVPLTRQSICVRLCDGYAFPVGDYHGAADRAPQETACQAACPDAQTALYVAPIGSDHIAQSVAVADGRPYSAMPDAFHYAQVLDGACTCHRPEGRRRTPSVLCDLTLRRGDAVMTARGFRVFHGASRFPYRHTDFASLARSADVRRTNRATFLALERESLKERTLWPTVPAAAAASRGVPADKPGA